MSAEVRDRLGALRALLFSPNSIYNLVLFTTHFGFVLTSSIIAPMLFRYYALPSSIEQRIPLPIIFHTCNDQLSGVCSFPSAAYSYDPGEVFSPDITYALHADFRLPETESNKHLGIFQAMWLLFFPLYMVGFFDDGHSVTITLTESYLETLTPTLIVTARFGLVRYLLYYWPLTTTVIVAIVVFSCIGSFFFLFWTHKAYAYLAQRQRAEAEQEQARVAVARELAKKPAAAVELKEMRKKEEVKVQNEEKEFVPENVDEVPECPTLGDIPGWEPEPSPPRLRKRVVNHQSSSELAESVAVRCADDRRELPRRGRADVAEMGAPSGLRGVELCPGFCARTVSVINNTEHYSDCDACSWGWRAMRHVICEECREFLPLYDWFFLAFCALIPLLLHSFFIYFYTTKSTFAELYQQACCLIECGLAAASALIFMPPRWSFRLYGCAGDAPNRIKDWYPAFYNPVVNFSRTLNCSHEVVFPLYSLPFIYFAFCLFFLVILRSLLYVTILRKEREHKQYYAALYCLPIVAGVHALFAGLLYHSFAYFTLLFAVGSSGVHLTREGKKSMRELLKRLRSSHRHHLLIAVNMILLAFAIVAIAVGRNLTWFTTATALVLVPVPPVFYVVTIGLTHPTQLLATGSR